MPRLVAFLKMIRLPMVFTAMADSAAGSLVGGGPRSLAALAGVMLISALIYSLGMLLNDLVDVRRDREIHPERPLVTGILSWKSMMAAAVLLAGAAVGAALATDPHRLGALSTTPVTVALLIAAVLYNLVSKHLGILGSVNMGLCRTLNLVLGFTVAADTYVGIPFALIAFVYILLVTSISLLEESPNRPMYITLMILLTAVPFSIPIISELPAAKWIPLAVAVPIVIRLIRSMRGFGRDQIRATIGTNLRLIIILDACFAAATDQWLGAALLLSLLGGVWASTRALKVMS